MQHPLLEEDIKIAHKSTSDKNTLKRKYLVSAEDYDQDIDKVDNAKAERKASESASSQSPQAPDNAAQEGAAASAPAENGVSVGNAIASLLGHNKNKKVKTTSEELGDFIQINEKRPSTNDGGDFSDDGGDAPAQNLSWKDVTPWLNRNIFKIRSPILRLHNEIIDFTNYIAPTEKEHEIRMESVDLITKIIKEVLPECEVKCFGSFHTRLYLPNADIDLAVLNKSMNDRTMYQRVARQLQARSDLYQDLVLVQSAKVPIIKFVETKTKINFDISFNKDDGLRQLAEVRRALQVYPEMRYLIFVLKCMLRQRELHETYTGGVGSFLLFCLILAFLREFRRQYIKEQRQKDLQNVSLSEYLIKFFEFYGCKHDWREKRIIMVDGGYIADKPQKDGAFSLFSPQDRDHDIGNAAFKIRDVFSVFKNRYHFMTNYNFEPNESLLKHLVNPSAQVFMFLKQEDQD